MGDGQVSEKKPAYPPSPPAQEFCLSVPLYEKFSYDDEKDNGFFALEQFDKTVDMYCPECGRHSVFTPRKNGFSRASHYTNHLFSLHFQCSRNASHHAWFVFRAHRGVLQKIGQTPALADLVLPDLKKYRAVLGDERHKELTRAIGLTAHGVGIGAFVYLRRVFESLIEEAHVKAIAEPGWDEGAYKNGRMAEKIELLEQHLPRFLVENRGLYGILSIGVHTLSEEDCLAAFPAVRLAIELILDDLLEERERQAKLKSAAQSIAALRVSGGRNEA